MQDKIDPIALATYDGVVTGMSKKMQKHPLYGTDAVDLHVRTPLTSVEEMYARELLKLHADVETIRFSIRSWAAQLGLAAFNPECTEVRLRSSHLEIDTLVSDISNKDDDVLMESLRWNADKKSARIGRAVLLPPKSKLGETYLPLLRGLHYDFDRTKLDKAELDDIWVNKPGREAIEKIRRYKGVVPEELQAGEYFLGAVKAESEDTCLVLEPELKRYGKKVSVLHDQSCLYDPLRTTGIRQVEIRNINGKAESTEDLVIVASVYRTNLDLYHCAHREGV